MKKEDIVAILRSYCEKEQSIIFGFLFGSYASDKTCIESDIDIALYLKTEDNRIENKIQNDIEKLLRKDIDLVILNRASSLLAWNIVRKGISLAIKDRGAYLDFMLEVSRDAEDLIDFNLDAWRRKYALRTS